MTVVSSIAGYIGDAIGTAVKSFQRASGGEYHRPEFLSSVAQEKRWDGGVFTQQDVAARRAIQNAWIYMSINRKAMEVSAGKVEVWYNPAGLEDTGKELPGHPFLKLMRRPNPYMGQAFFWQFTQWWLDLLGNAYWFISLDDNGKLVELWPMPANAVDPIPGDKDRFVDYYEYQANGTVFKIPAEYIVHFQYPNPFDVFRGMSPLIAALLPADSDTGMSRYNGTFFSQDNVMPSAIIALSSGDPHAPLDPADVQTLKDEFSSSYGATSRKTAITNAFDMSVQLLGWNAKDMDFISGRTFTREEIWHIYGIPPALFVANSTEAGATVGDSVFKEKTIWPIFGLYAEQITVELLQRYYGKQIECRFTDIRIIDRVMLLNQSNGSNGILTLDERRKKFWDMEPLPNGEGAGLAPKQPEPPMGAGLPGQEQGLPDSTQPKQSPLSSQATVAMPPMPPIPNPEGGTMKPGVKNIDLELLERLDALLDANLKGGEGSTQLDEMLPVSELSTYVGYPTPRSDDEIDALRAWMRGHKTCPGKIRVRRKPREILDGNHRVQIAKELEIKELPIEWTDGSPEEDLRKWRTRSVKSFSDGRDILAEFVSDEIPEETKSFILTGLEQATTVDEIKEVFDSVIKGEVK